MEVTSLLSREKRIMILQMCSCSLPSPLHSSECWILSERQVETTDWKRSLLEKKFGLTYMYSKPKTRSKICYLHCTAVSVGFYPNGR
jgi:hypothetical protein